MDNRKKKVEIVIFGDDGSVLREIPMDRETSGYYSVIDPASAGGTLYKYRLDDNLVPDWRPDFNRRESMAHPKWSTDVHFIGQTPDGSLRPFTNW